MSKLQIPPNEGSSTYGVHNTALPYPAESRQGQRMSLGRRTVGGAIVFVSGALMWAFNAFGFVVDVVSAPEDAGTLRGAAIAALRKFAEIPDWGVYLFLAAILLIGLLMLLGWHPDRGWRWLWSAKVATEVETQPTSAAPPDPTKSTPTEEIAPRPSVRDLFENEINPQGGTVLTYLCGGDLTFADGATLEYFHRLFCDFSAHAKYVAYYIPPTKQPEAAILGIIKAVEDHVDADLHAIINQATSEVGPIDEKSLTFTGKVYVYHDDDLNPSQLGRIYDAFTRAGLQPDFRGPRYALRQKPLQRPKTPGQVAFKFAEPVTTQRTRPSAEEEPPPKAGAPEAEPVDSGVQAQPVYATDLEAEATAMRAALLVQRRDEILKELTRLIDVGTDVMSEVDAADLDWQAAVWDWRSYVKQFVSLNEKLIPGLEQEVYAGDDPFRKLEAGSQRLLANIEDVRLRLEYALSQDRFDWP